MEMVFYKNGVIKDNKIKNGVEIRITTHTH
jgi:hypothetical protein